MSQPTSRLNHRQREATVSQQQSAQATAALEFASAEEMLRHDAAQSSVPPALAERLQQSVAGEPVPQKPWWRRLLKG
jgi:hypothetical protein